MLRRKAIYVKYAVLCAVVFTILQLNLMLFKGTTTLIGTRFKIGKGLQWLLGGDDVLDIPEDLRHNHSHVCTQEERFARLYTHCPKRPSLHDIDSMTDEEIDQMSRWYFVAENLKTLTCMHYKAGWTSQRLIFMNNSAEEPTKPVEAADGTGQFRGMEKLNISYLSDKKYTTAQKRYMLGNYFKYIIVRHPFDRILSGYRDKLIVELDPNIEHTGDYYTVMLPRILKKIKPELLSEPLEKIRIPFSYVVEYLKQGGFDWHFHGPYDDVCFHCKMKFDYIGKVETWDHDMSYIIDNHFPKKRGKSTKGNVNSEHLKIFFNRLEEFEDLTDQEISVVAEKYEKDLKQFAYTWEKRNGKFYTRCEGGCC